VHVPETAIDVDNLPPSWEHEVRRARERTNVQTVTVAEGMHETADC
jgi:hypothetical protein